MLSVYGICSAQTEFQLTHGNAITVDVGPTLAGLAVGSGMKKFEPKFGDNASGIGIGAQYERQLSGSLSVAGRFAYLGADLGLIMEERPLKVALDMSMSSFSLEGHARYYLFNDTFFVDGMLGYANLSANLKGNVRVSIAGVSIPLPVSVSFSPSRNYLKLGAKLGWKLDFGKTDVFFFEPSFGYSYGIGLGETIEKQLEKKAGGIVSDFNDVFKPVENYIFVGGPKLSLAFGLRF